MDFKDDYIHFQIENKDILEELKNESTLTYDLIEPVIMVLDHLIEINFEVEGETKDTLEDIFNIGFHYLYDLVTDIRRILEDSFDDEIDELIDFDSNLYLYLRCDELDSIFEGKNETISSILDNLENSFVYKRKFNDSQTELIEQTLSDSMSQTEEITISDEFLDYCDFFHLDII